MSNGLKPPTSYVVYLPFLLEVNLESHLANIGLHENTFEHHERSRAKKGISKKHGDNQSGPSWVLSQVSRFN